MAQKPKSVRRRALSLAKRYGLMGGRGIVVASLVVVTGLGAIGALRLAEGGSTVVERAPAASEVQQDDFARRTETTAEEKKPETEKQEEKSASIVVHVDGAVAAPGVYVLAIDFPRINDAVQKAGGLTDEADTSAINLAALLEDGQKVHVPVTGEAIPEVTEGTATAAAAHTEDSGRASLVNINSATEAELQTLPGVGEATAAAIVQDRQNMGEFSATEDLMRVSGIGEKKYAKIKDLICV